MDREITSILNMVGEHALIEDAPVVDPSIERGISRLNLPSDTKEKLRGLVRVPGGKYNSVQEALKRLEYKPGESNERAESRAVRCLLWSLVHYQGQLIPYHTYASWKEGHAIAPNGAEVQAFTKAIKKVRTIIGKYKMNGVGLMTSRSGPKSISVSGFRLSVSPDDYSANVFIASSRKVLRVQQAHLRTISSDFINSQDVEDPNLRAIVKDEQEYYAHLKAQNLLAPLPDRKRLK